MQRILIDRQSQLDRLRIRCEHIEPDRQLELKRERTYRLLQQLKLAIAG